MKTWLKKLLGLETSEKEEKEEQKTPETVKEEESDTPQPTTSNQLECGSCEKVINPVNDKYKTLAGGGGEKYVVHISCWRKLKKNAKKESGLR